jgi:hypothetical protein
VGDSDVPVGRGVVHLSEPSIGLRSVAAVDVGVPKGPVSTPAIAQDDCC